MRWISGESGARYRVEDSAFSRTDRWAMRRCRDEAGASYVYKVYTKPLGSEGENGSGRDGDAERLTELARLGRSADPAQPGHDAIGWLADTVVEDRAVVGVVLRAAPPGFYNFGRDPRTFERLHTRASYPPEASVRIKVLVSLCELFTCLEHEGLVHGRLSARKVLWRSDTAPHAYLLGGDKLHPALVGASPGSDNDSDSDRRALAGLIFRGLLLADDERSVPSGLDDRIRVLFHRAFADPKADEPRPSPAEWREALCTVTAADIDRLTASHTDENAIEDYEYDEHDLAEPGHVHVRTESPYRIDEDEAAIPGDEGPFDHARTGLLVNASPRRVALIGGGLVAVAAVFIAVAIHPSSTPSPYTYTDPSAYPQSTPYTTDPNATTDPSASQATDQATDTQQGGTAAQQQAQAISGLVNNSSSDRSLVTRAVQSEISGCTDPSQGLTDLRQAVTDRAQQLAAAQQLDASAIDNGRQLLSDLVNALTYSSEADQAYASWAADVETNGCNGDAQPDNNFTDGDNYSKQAETAKNAFLQDWQSVAAQYGLPVPTPDSF